MIQPILVPIDFSRPSLQALDRAVALGKSLGAEIVVLHVVEPVYYALAGETYGIGLDLGDVYRQVEGDARARLTKIAARLQARGVKARTLIESGTAHRVIVDRAAKLKARMIVMSTHGRSGFSHVLLGSVAERVLRTASCPVLTVRVPQDSTPSVRRTPKKRAAKARQPNRVAPSRTLPGNVVLPRSRFTGSLPSTSADT